MKKITEIQTDKFMNLLVQKQVSLMGKVIENRKTNY